VTGKPDSELMRAAIALLARRDHGRVELGQRLLRRLEGARFSSRAAPTDPAAEVEVDRAAQRSQRATAVDLVLDTLQAKGLLSEARFVNEFVRARASRFGPVRLRHELQRRGVDQGLIDTALQAQVGDELARARTLWRQRFGAVATASAERARQARFLAARGFSHDIVRRVVGGKDAD
jgi:regulatory protein